MTALRLRRRTACNILNYRIAVVLWNITGCAKLTAFLSPFKDVYKSWILSFGLYFEDIPNCLLAAFRAADISFPMWTQSWKLLSDLLSETNVNLGLKNNSFRNWRNFPDFRVCRVEASTQIICGSFESLESRLVFFGDINFPTENGISES